MKVESGKRYIIKRNGRMMHIHVIDISIVSGWNSRRRTQITAINEATKRRIILKSTRQFLSEIL